MFGVDWDGDGKDGILDDFITMDILEDEDRRGGGKPNGSCLVFLLMIGSAVALPIVGVIKFWV